MSRISIDVTPQQHKRLKAMAALKGQTIKQFVLDKTLANTAENRDEQYALKKLEDLLDERSRDAESRRASDQTVEDVFKEAYLDSNS